MRVEGTARVDAGGVVDGGDGSAGRTRERDGSGAG